MKQRRDTWDYFKLWEKSGKVIPYFYEKFGIQLQDMLNMAEDIDSEPICEDWELASNGMVKRGIYLGSMFSITPSGKFYTPWTNSNVSVKEAAIDELWQEFMEENLRTHNLSLEYGEADNTDMFLYRYYNIEDIPKDELYEAGIIDEDQEWERDEFEIDSDRGYPE